MREPLRSAERAPQILFVVAPDETSHVEAKRRARPSAESERTERNSEHGGPASCVASYGDFPDPVPIGVLVIPTGELRIPHRSQGIRSEFECATAVMNCLLYTSPSPRDRTR